MITKDKIMKVLPGCKQPELWEAAFLEHLPKEWNKNQLAAFLAQCAHESSSFNVTRENLNYSEQGLLKIFPKYFGPGKANAKDYARNPKKIANLVYGNRMGNGPEESGDGFMFSGRGLIQLTGRDNYEKFSQAINDPHVLSEPDCLTAPDMALKSAIWFWTTNKIDQEGDFVKITRKVNGGTIGLEHRVELYNKFLEVL